MMMCKMVPCNAAPWHARDFLRSTFRHGYCHDHLYHKAFDYDSAIAQINRNLVDFFQQSPAIANRIKEDPGSGKLRNGIATTSYFRVDVAGVEFDR